MKQLARRVHSVLVLFGIDLRKTTRSLRGLPGYRRDLRLLKRQMTSVPEPFAFGTSRPCLGEESSDSGLAKGHYFHQDLLAARRISLNNPTVHVDVGSRIDGFVAHVAAFRSIEVLDIRPLPGEIPNVRFVRADLMAPVHDELVDYCDSLSCLHALEHFGLGRYGDPIDHDGHLRGLDNLYRILKTGGTLYLSVPIGPQRIEFNAHRVFSVDYLIECLADRYRIDRFSFVDDRGDLHEDVPITGQDALNSFGCQYGCGIFEMTKS